MYQHGERLHHLLLFSTNIIAKLFLLKQHNVNYITSQVAVTRYDSYTFLFIQLTEVTNANISNNLWLILSHTVICWKTFCGDPDNFKISLFTNNLTGWGSLGSSNILLLTMDSFALKQFASTLNFIVPFQWQHEKQKNWSPWLNVDYKQLLDNIIATVVWR